MRKKTWAISVAVVLFICGCTSTKELETATSALSQIESINIDSVVNEAEKIAQSMYDEKLRIITNELKRVQETGVSFSNPCDSTNPSPVINTVEVKPDGTIKASGNIKDVSLKLSEQIKKSDSAWSKKVDSLIIEIQSEINLKIKAEDELKAVQESKNLNKKTKVFNQWWLLLIVLIIGIIIGVRFRDNIKGVISKAKHVSSKIFS